MSIDINFMVGGEAGQGVQSVGFLLAKALARGGYNVFADQDYESRVRGGHNFYRVRASDTYVGAIAPLVDVLVALNKQTIDLHRKEMAKGGIIIYDGEKMQGIEESGGYFSVPMERLAMESAGDKLSTNTVAFGAALGLAGYDFDIMEKAVRSHFASSDSGEKNVAAAKSGYEYARDRFKGKFKHQIKPLANTGHMLLNGNEALTLGAIAAGCKFMAAYPMTPATSIMEYFASKSVEFGLQMVHAEDEISAINMAIGAAYAGVRAMTATSGSGFCLMVEGLGLAGITETPLVVIDAQRPGPAVGLPTGTEQGDLTFVVYAHHGEFPRAVLAPSTVEEAFWLTAKAFNLAEKYQTPVLILTDQHLASCYQTVDKFDLSKVIIDRGDLFSPADSGQSEYKRHKLTSSGISPRAFPGLGEALVVTDSDEHDEAGHLNESADMRNKMMRKRMHKMIGLQKEIDPPQIYGPRKAETTLIGWGSTYGAIREAVDIMRADDISVNALHLSGLWPLPAKAVADAMGGARRTCAVEGNATSQLAQLIAAETGKKVDFHINKFDGRPFTPQFIVKALRKEIR